MSGFFVTFCLDYLLCYVSLDSPLSKIKNLFVSSGKKESALYLKS
jgi:hypothetical protein